MPNTSSKNPLGRLFFINKNGINRLIKIHTVNEEGIWVQNVFGGMYQPNGNIIGVLYDWEDIKDKFPEYFI